MLILKRVSLSNVGPFEHITVDLSQRTLVSGHNASNKTSFLRAVACLIGLSGESIQALVRTDAEGVPVEGVIPEGIAWLEGDGDRFRITRRGAKEFSVDRAEGDSWRPVPPTPDAALKALFDRGSSPADFLSEKLSTNDRIGLLLEVADSKAPVAKPEVPGFTFDPIHRTHPLDVIEAMQAQLFAHRTKVGSDQKAAAAMAQRMVTGLPAEAPEDMADEVAKLREAVTDLEAEIRAGDERIKAALDLALAGHANHEFSALRGAEHVRDEAIREAEERFQLEANSIKADGERKRKAARDVAENSRIALNATSDTLRTRTAELAEATTRQLYANEDRTLRQKAAEAQADADKLAARWALLTKAIEDLKAQAAAMIGASLPGVRIETDEKGKRALLVQTAGGWQEWSDANTEAQVAVAGLFSILHQQRRPKRDCPQLMLVLLDGAESMDEVHRRLRMGEWGESAQVIMSAVSDGELEFKNA